MNNKKCPCDQFTDEKPLPEDENLICVFWNFDKNTCNIVLEKEHEN